MEPTPTTTSVPMLVSFRPPALLPTSSTSVATTLPSLRLLLLRSLFTSVTPLPPKAPLAVPPELLQHPAAPPTLMSLAPRLALSSVPPRVVVSAPQSLSSFSLSSLAYCGGLVSFVLARRSRLSCTTTSLYPLAYPPRSVSDHAQRCFV